MSALARPALALAVTLAACSSEGTDQGPASPGAGQVRAGGAETGRLVGMVAAHNEVRHAVSAAPPLPDLVWSSDLAGVAQSYADRLAPTCGLEHSGGPYGENLAMLGGQRGTPAQIVGLWSGEGACYSFGAFEDGDRCAAACGTCGHYTQLVWRDTRLVGCGVAECPGGNEEEVWVCNYDPPGNFVGEEPY